MTPKEWLIKELKKGWSDEEVDYIFELFEQAKQMELKAKENTYTEEQVREAIEKTTNFEIGIVAQQEATFAPSFVRGVEWFKEKIIQSLKQPK